MKDSYFANYDICEEDNKSIEVIDTPSLPLTLTTLAHLIGQVVQPLFLTK